MVKSLIELSIWIILLRTQLGWASTVKLSEPDYHLAPHPCRASSLETSGPYLGVPWGVGGVERGETHRQIRIRPMWTRLKGCLVGGPARSWPPRVIKWHGIPFKPSWLFFTPLRTHIFWKEGREGWFFCSSPWFPLAFSCPLLSWLYARKCWDSVLFVCLF